jgi:hypothetical protein
MRSSSRAGTKPIGAKKVRTSLLGKTLPLIQLPDRLIRISKKSYADPIHWSKLGVHRFDSPVAIYGVLYTSNTVETAILEVFGDQWAEFHEIDSADLALFDVCELQVTSRLRSLTRQDAISTGLVPTPISLLLPTIQRRKPGLASSWRTIKLRRGSATILERIQPGSTTQYLARLKHRRQSRSSAVIHSTLRFSKVSKSPGPP